MNSLKLRVRAARLYKGRRFEVEYRMALKNFTGVQGKTIALLCALMRDRAGLKKGFEGAKRFFEIQGRKILSGRRPSLGFSTKARTHERYSQKIIVLSHALLTAPLDKIDSPKAVKTVIRAEELALGAAYRVLKKAGNGFPGARMAIVFGGDEAIDGLKEEYFRGVIAHGAIGASPLLFHIRA